MHVIDANLNWQRSAKTHAWQVEALAEGHVIVDATGDPATALFLAAVAEANGRAFVSVEVFEGGIGALIAACVGYFSYIMVLRADAPRSVNRSNIPSPNLG